MGFILNAIFVLLAAPTALAARETFDLQLSLSIEGASPTLAHLIVNEGEAAMIEQESPRGSKIFIEVVATLIENNLLNGAKPSVLMKFNVGTLMHGKKTTLFSPRINANEGEQTKIVESAQDGAEKFELTALVTHSRI